MKRRTLLAASPTLLSPWLAACGGGGKSSATTPAAPSTPSNTYGLGLTPASAEILESIATVNAQSVESVSTVLSSTAPSYFDLSDTGALALAGWPAVVPPIGNQGAQGSCVAWGVGYAMASSAINIGNGTLLDSSARLVSPADLYAKVLRRRAFTCGNGTIIRDAMDVLVEEGAATLAYTPYSDAQCTAPQSNAPMVIDGYMKLAVTDRAGIKRAIESFKLVPFGMQIYEDFYGIGGAIYNGPAAGKRNTGGHCMALVGYDDRIGAYRAVNSWGPYWGAGGYVQIAYEAFERLCNEVYVPYVHASGLPNNLYDQREVAGNGIVLGLSANARGVRDAANSSSFSVHVNFKLADYMKVTGYSIVFWRDVAGSLVPTVVADRRILQSLRGAVFTERLTDATVLGNSAVVSLNLAGYDRHNTVTQRSLFMRYPGVGGR